MNYEAIQTHITRARIERSVVIAEILADLIVAGWQSAKQAAVSVRVAIENTSNYLPRSQA